MRSLNSSELLNVWEAGLDNSLIDKTLSLLALACSTTDIHLLAQMSIGERDARLLQLRKWMFGSKLVNIAHCPKCSEQVEWESQVKDLQLQSFSSDLKEASYHFTSADYHILFRLPNSNDLKRIGLVEKYQSHPQHLTEDCILEVKKGERICQIDELPQPVFEEINQQMAKEDPQANISVLLNCPTCSHQWESFFDIVHYLWVEIDNWAKHILQEVGALAQAFGWSEQDILNMSPRRRQLYLNMLRS